MRAIALILVAALSPALSVAQAPTTAVPRSRSATFAVGGGSSFGWWGIQVERYVAQASLSMFLGAGRDADLRNLNDKAANFAFAGGLRAYTRGLRDRAFVEMSISEVMAEPVYANFGRVKRTPRYGPGLQVGYQFISHGGLTAMASLGRGYAVGVQQRDRFSRWVMLASFGIGYTFR